VLVDPARSDGIGLAECPHPLVPPVLSGRDQAFTIPSSKILNSLTATGAQDSTTRLWQLRGCYTECLDCRQRSAWPTRRLRWGNGAILSREPGYKPGGPDDSGEAVAVIGPNGAGKTTTLRMVSLGHRGFMGIGAYNHRAAVELSPSQPVDRHSTRDAGGSGCGGADWLSPFPLPHHRALFRAADIGAERHCAAGHHCDARHHRRLPRLYAGALQMGASRPTR